MSRFTRQPGPEPAFVKALLEKPLRYGPCGASRPLPLPIVDRDPGDEDDQCQSRQS